MTLRTPVGEETILAKNIQKSTTLRAHDIDYAVATAIHMIARIRRIEVQAHFLLGFLEVFSTREVYAPGLRGVDTSPDSLQRSAMYLDVMYRTNTTIRGVYTRVPQLTLVFNLVGI